MHQLKEHESVAKNLRRVHLHNRYKLASNLKDSHKKQEIMQVIWQEEQKDDWNWIQCATGEPRLGATPKVQRIENGEVIDIVIASEMNREVQIVTEQQFDLAKSAPIQLSSLRGSLGFCLATDFSLQLLQGKSNIPTDADETMTLLIWEI
jgi:hypothetical protein